MHKIMYCTGKKIRKCERSKQADNTLAIIIIIIIIIIIRTMLHFHL